MPGKATPIIWLILLVLSYKGNPSLSWTILGYSMFAVLFSQTPSFLRALLLLEGLALAGIILSSIAPLTISLFATLMIISGGEAVMGLSLLAYSLRKADSLMARPKI